MPTIRRIENYKSYLIGFVGANSHQSDSFFNLDMETKKCTKCGEVKNYNLFYNRKDLKDYKDIWCKECRENSIITLHRTKAGLVKKIYLQQKARSKISGHDQPTYTKEQFKNWIFSQDLFHYLYKKWVKSGYDPKLIPSIDRKNDYIGYSFDNIQLMTWEENRKKGYYGRSKAVLQFNITGVIINEYYSIREAARKIGISHKDISRCCRCKRKTAGGYVFAFKD